MNSVKLVAINGRYTHSCLALFYLRNELEKYCPAWNSELLQLTVNDNYFESLVKVSCGNPRYVFFSAAIWNSELVEKFTRDLAVFLPATRVIIGGPQASVLHEKLKPLNHTVVLGAVEAVGHRFYGDVDGGTLQTKYTADFFAMAVRGFDYPYRKADFTTHLANRHIYYESSRGCFFSCSYCLSSVEKGVYHKPLDVVKKELRDILLHQPKVVRFIDRTFNDVPRRTLSIWEFLLEEGGETLFHFEMAPDRFTDEMFAFLEQVEPGKFQFEIGIQSTNPATLAAVNRTVDSAVVHSTVERLSGLGTIHLHVDLILGLPFETADTFAKSFADVFAMGANYIQMGLLKILPETPLCSNRAEYEYKHSLTPPYSVLESRWMDYSTIQDLYWFSECVEKFMNNRYFVLLWKYFRKSGEDMYSFFRTLLTHCRETNFFSYAPTHELMGENLIAVLEKRADSELLKELLRMDWLRCNHRFLPPCFMVDGNCEQPKDTKNIMLQTLPDEIEGVFTKHGRNRFFRKTFFLRISKKAGAESGFQATFKRPVLCFQPESENSLYSYSKMLVF